MTYSAIWKQTWRIPPPSHDILPAQPQPYENISYTEKKKKRKRKKEEDIYIYKKKKQKKLHFF